MYNDVTLSLLKVFHENVNMNAKSPNGSTRGLTKVRSVIDFQIVSARPKNTKSFAVSLPLKF